MPKKIYALVPSVRLEECDHQTVAYTGQIPCTGPLKCSMCGSLFSNHNEVVQERAYLHGLIGGALEIRRHRLRNFDWRGAWRGYCQRININHITVASVYPWKAVYHTEHSLRERPLRRLDINPALVGRE